MVHGTMITPQCLAKKIRSIGFRCTSCGRCCRSDAVDPGVVMVLSDEVRAIMAATGLAWGEITQPYPAVIEDGAGGRYTIGWCLRRSGDTCRFLAQGRCQVYLSRPWICRTYPFMLDGDDLVVSACEGLGRKIRPGDALRIARDLLERRSTEEAEAERITRIFSEHPLPAGPLVVVDCEGMKVIDG